jgi:hypothetical protein
MPRVPKARPSDTLSRGSIAKPCNRISNKHLIAYVRKHFFGPAKRHYKKHLPWLRLAHRRFCQPGCRVPVKGRPTLRYSREMTRVCSAEVIHRGDHENAVSGACQNAMQGSCHPPRDPPLGLRALHAFGVDDDDGSFLALRQIVFSVRITFNEHK